MSEFLEAFKKGINLALVSENNKLEIKSVFESISEEISEALNHEIKISPYTFKRKKTAEETIVSIGRSASTEVTYEGIAFQIVTKDPNLQSYELINDPPLLLAYWEDSETGYPCAIKAAFSKFICNNLEDLNEALKQLISDPIIGIKIFELLKKHQLNYRLNDIEN